MSDNQTPATNQWRRVLFPLLLLSFLFLDFFVLPRILDEPFAQKVQSKLETEFKKIAPFSQTILESYQADHGTEYAFVESRYQTTSSHTEIQAHYDRELTKQGWQLSTEEITTYRKGEFCAQLQSVNQSYTLNLKWGVRECSQQGWQRQTASTALFLLGFSILILAQTATYGWVALTKDAEAYFQFVLRHAPKRISINQSKETARAIGCLASVIGGLMGLFIFFAGIYALWRYLRGI